MHAATDYSIEISSTSKMRSAGHRTEACEEVVSRVDLQKTTDWQQDRKCALCVPTCIGCNTSTALSFVLCFDVAMTDHVERQVIEAHVTTGRDVTEQGISFCKVVTASAVKHAGK